MKALLQNTISLFRLGIAPLTESFHENSMNLIFSGYSPAHAVDKAGSLDRKSVGILYADVVDYTRLTEQDEAGTHQRLVQSMKSMKAHVSANNGRVAHFAGDAILAEFQDASSALLCAVNMQLDAWQWNVNLHPNKHVLFRIGVNYGDVISDHGDIYGNAVNLTARLEKLACCGGICVSKSVRSELEGNTVFSFVALGKQYVKNIREPVQAFWIEMDRQQFVTSKRSNAMNKLAVASS